MTLSDHWHDGMRTLHGLQTHGFPNCFFLGFTQTAVTVSVPYALNEQAKHAGYIIDEAHRRERRRRRHHRRGRAGLGGRDEGQGPRWA